MSCDFYILNACMSMNIPSHYNVVPCYLGSNVTYSSLGLDLKMLYVNSTLILNFNVMKRYVYPLKN
jgi:hypothetical protein